MICNLSHWLDLACNTLSCSTKLSLYASFSETLAAHRAELRGREDTLDKVRKTLIRNGGNVVQVRSDDGQVGRDATNVLSNRPKPT